ACRMAYAVLETTDVLGNKEILAAPEGWVRCTNGKQYLCWPNVRNINSLNALLQDAHSVPSLMWEKHECVIKRSNLATLALATKAIDDMQNPSPEKGASANATSSSPAANTQNEKSSPTPVWEKRNCKIICQEVPSLAAGEKTIEIIHNSSDAGTSDQSTGTNKNLIDTIAKATSTSSMKGGKCKTAIAQNSKTVAYDPPSVGSTLILKYMMISNQKEIRKIVSESMGKIHRTVNLLLHKKVDEDAEEGPRHLYERVDPEEFTFDPLTTVEQVEKFDEQLREDKYRKEIYGWVESNVGYESSSEHRMHTMLDLIFDRQLFAKFSWSGLNKKHPMQVFRNIVQLFEYIGSSSVQRIKREQVKQFLMKKLKQADSRKNKTFIRKSVPHQRRKFEEREWAQSRASKVKRRATETKPSSTPSGQMSGDEERAAARSVAEQPNVNEKQKDDEVQQHLK
ncbi:AGAP011075-PA, partial [Anopheles gambiae str. PEST]